MRKKIGIITIVNGYNYGNVLQNYALQRAIAKVGCDFETINHTVSHSNNSFLGLCRMYLGLAVKLCLGKKNQLYVVRRIKAFQNFKKKYIRYCNFRIKNSTFPPDRMEEYAVFVFGSDQIWNLKFEFIQKECNIYFGKFAERKKKIAYAGSFGSVDIPDHLCQYVSESLKDFRAVSVRETAGKELCTQLGVDSVVVPDPTLLLSPSEWRLLEKCPFQTEKHHYLLTYFLGKTSDQIQKEICQYADQNGLKLINMNNSLMFCRTEQDRRLLALGPEAFLWLIDHCTAFVTDSFHGTVFSLIFRKPFQVIDRVANEENNNMSSRLETLLELFQESKRLCSEHLNYALLSNQPDPASEQIHQVLSKQGATFLQENLMNS